MTNPSEAFLNIEPGQLVRCQGKRYKITHFITVSCVMAIDLETDNLTRLQVEQLEPDRECDTKTLGSRDISEYTKEEWENAHFRFEVIKGFLNDTFSSRIEVEKAAKKIGKHPATIYRWIKLFQDSGHLSSLIPQKRGTKVGARLLTPEQELIIKTAIDERYLTKQRLKHKDIILAVQASCRLAKIDAPSPNTIRSRINSIDPSTALRRRGQPDKARTHEPVRGELLADYPMQLVQIDHTEVDVQIVDEVDRQVIGRPYLTLAIDVSSRMVPGLYLSLDPPSSLSVAMCIAHAMCTKREYLAKLGVPGEWPVWGKIGTLYADNAPEFKSEALRLGCEEYGIDLQWRPRKTPHYGGHIERLMGTTSLEFHRIPGTTFSNTQQVKEYDSEAMAVMTLRELEAHIVDFIVNQYHQNIHSSTKLPPLELFRREIEGYGTQKGVGLIAPPKDQRLVAINFMPLFRRTVQRIGIELDLVFYYAPVLDKWINSVDPQNRKEARKFLIRRDPRDISRVFFYDPTDQCYHDIPYRNMGHPPISLFELKAVKKRLKAEGLATMDEDAIFASYARGRERIEQAEAKTKAARRARSRKHSHETTHIPVGKVTEPPRTPVQSSSLRQQPKTSDTDPFAEPLEEFQMSLRNEG